LLVDSMDDADLDDEQNDLLERHAEKPQSTTTVGGWTRQLGHEHSARKKSFHVDGHERAKQRFH
jgi:hypothetical protein